jgi:hypothetical protein
MKLPLLTRVTLLVVGLGAVLHVCTTFRSGGKELDFEGAAFLGGLLLWSCLPYVIWTSLAVIKEHSAMALGAATGTLGFDLYMHYGVFIAPTSSTAALGLLFAPFWNLVLFGPLGAAIEWPLSWFFSSRRNST